MFSTLSQITPILFGFVVGHLLRRSGVARESDGTFIFKLVFYVCIPALIFHSLATVHLSEHLLIFTLLATLLYIVGFAVGMLALNRLALPALQKPVFLIGAMGLNSIFALPYLQSLYGSEGVARFAAYDVANTILLYSWTYSIAVRANPHHQGNGILTRRLLSSPPLYAVVIGIGTNLLNFHIPSAIANVTTAFSGPTGFLVTVAIGIALDPKRDDLDIAVRTISVRLGTALVVGLAIIGIFGLTGADRTAALLLCTAPVAFASATFASLENLDVKLAAGTLSISLALSVGLATAVALILA